MNSEIRFCIRNSFHLLARYQEDNSSFYQRSIYLASLLQLAWHTSHIKLGGVSELGSDPIDVAHTNRKNTISPGFVCTGTNCKVETTSPGISFQSAANLPCLCFPYTTSRQPLSMVASSMVIRVEMCKVCPYIHQR